LTTYSKVIFLENVMKNFSLKGKVILGACLTATLSVSNAEDSIGTVSQVTGVAVVSEGAQYVKAHEGLQLQEGDRIMVLEGGSAVISFTDGCQYKLADNEVLTIGLKSTCASDAAGSYKIEPYSAVSQNPNAAAASMQPAAIGGTSAYGANLGWVPVAAGGVVLIGAVASSNSGSGGSTFVPIPGISP
jgi:hypothetical protein